MSHSTKREQLEQESFTISVEENQNRESSHLMEREPVDNTPFFIIGNSVDGYFLTLGKYRISGVYDDKDKVMMYLEHEFWNVLVDVVGVLVAGVEEVRKAEQ